MPPTWAISCNTFVVIKLAVLVAFGTFVVFEQPALSVFSGSPLVRLELGHGLESFALEGVILRGSSCSHFDV